MIPIHHGKILGAFGQCGHCRRDNAKFTGLSPARVSLDADYGPTMALQCNLLDTVRHAIAVTSINVLVVDHHLHCFSIRLKVEEEQV